MPIKLTYSWKQLRLSHGWSQTQVLHRLETAAAGDGVRLPARASLKTMLSRWENGHPTSTFYTGLLCRVYQLPDPHRPAVDRRRWRNCAVFGRVLGNPVPATAGQPIDRPTLRVVT